MTRVHIKPLSINCAYRGRRFSTPAHKKHKNILAWLLPAIKLPPPPYEIYFKFGFSSKASDWDNCIKVQQDSLADRYKFNDKLIRRGVVETEIVAKGEEYFAFEITHYEK